jgi:RNA recognition motif-containing protein
MCSAEFPLCSTILFQVEINIGQGYNDQCFFSEFTFLRRTCRMGKRLHVGNLAYSLKSQELEEVFRQVGEVASVKVVTDRETGRSKGFAFVEMTSDEGAQRAIEELNGKDVSGRALKVTEANPRPERPEGGNRFGGRREGGFRGKRTTNSRFDE